MFAAENYELQASKEGDGDTYSFLQATASVDKVNIIPGQSKDTKVYSFSGGDPAINGHNITLAVFNNTKMEYDVFQLSNASSFKIIKSNVDGLVIVHIVQDGITEDGEVISNHYILRIKTINASKGIIEVAKEML